MCIAIEVIIFGEIMSSKIVRTSTIAAITFGASFSVLAESLPQVEFAPSNGEIAKQTVLKQAGHDGPDGPGGPKTKPWPKF